MARIHGVTLSDNKQIAYALADLYGIGLSLSLKILVKTGVARDKKVSQLTEEELKKIIKIIDENYRVEGDLKEEINTNIKNLKDIGCYRGIRHLRNLPVHGQRTRSNARTKRGKRKTVGALKKEVWNKMEQGEQKTGDQRVK